VVISQRTQSPILCLSMVVLIIFGVVLTSFIAILCCSVVHGLWYLSFLCHQRFLTCIPMPVHCPIFAIQWFMGLDFLSLTPHFQQMFSIDQHSDTSQMFQLKYISKSISVNLLFDLLFATTSKFQEEWKSLQQTNVCTSIFIQTMATDRYGHSFYHWLKNRHRVKSI